jgi:hypothetical protein
MGETLQRWVVGPRLVVTYFQSVRIFPSNGSP